MVLEEGAGSAGTACTGGRWRDRSDVEATRMRSGTGIDSWVCNRNRRDRSCYMAGRPGWTRTCHLAIWVRVLSSVTSYGRQRAVEVAASARSRIVRRDHDSTKFITDKKRGGVW